MSLSVEETRHRRMPRNPVAVAETGGLHLQAMEQGWLATPEAKGEAEKDSPLEASQEHSPVNTLISGFYPLEL